MLARHPWLLAVPLLLAIPACLPAQEELLKNPGFEQVGAKGLPEGWTQYAGGAPQSQLKVVTDAHSGGKALRLIDTGPKLRDQRYSIGVFQEVPVTGGQFYLGRVWAKALARNNPEAVVLQMTFTGGKVANYARYIKPPIDGKWHRVSVGGQAPAGAKTVRFYLYTMHYWTSNTILDDASLTTEDKSMMGVQAALWQYGEEPLAQVRPLHLRTPIAVGGQAAAVIAAPATPDYQALARELQAGITRKCGVTLPIATDIKGLLKTSQTIIAIGNMNNNFILERLYFNFYTGANSLWPGAGNYALRTVAQPFNFTPDTNVLTVESSDLAGARKGVADLLQRLPAGPDAALDKPLLFVSTTKPLSAAATRKLLTSPTGIDLWRDFWSACERYRDTGDIAYAEQARRFMTLCEERYQKTPRYSFTWPEETTSDKIGAMWDVIEEAPVWTDQERLQATNALYVAMLSLVSHVSAWDTLPDNDTIIWNHTTFPLLGIFWLARYFQRYYNDASPVFDDYMAHVQGAFRGQVKSWKPQEDADGYLTIVPRHTIEYTLAQDDYTYFENGNVRRFAEYLTGLCDNQGSIPGLGDSGYGKGPGYELSGLPIALWYYKDGRYLWRLEQIYHGKWANPYDPSVKPVPWQGMAGLTVWRMAPELYRWACTHSSYDEPLAPPNVPYDKAFDKITFRQNIKPDCQFMLLDGFARGKHLHYDGNAIIKYHDDDQDWLIDGDYLVRNTTEHTMISVIHNGRCAKLEPSATGLETYGDLPACAYTRTTVTDYNGADWARNILWVKGSFFVLLDELKAREKGDYIYEGVFKTLNRGKQQLTDGRIFSTIRPTNGGVGSRDLGTVRNPVPGVATAARFKDASSRLDCGLNLPAGKYAVTIYAQGVNTGADSFWLTIDNGAPVAFHIPIDTIGPSSSTPSKDTPTPNVTIPTNGLHHLRVTLREGPGPLLQKIVIADASGKQVAVIDPLHPPQLPADQLKPAPDACFYVKSDGLVQESVSTRINNVNLKLRYLHELFGGNLQAGDIRSSQNVFYNDRSDHPLNLDLRRLNTFSCLLLKAGQPWGIFTSNAPTLKDLAVLGTDARACFLTPGMLAIFGATRFGNLQLSRPCSLQVDLAQNTATAYCTEETVATINGKRQELAKGQSALSLTGCLQPATVRQAVPGLLAAAAGAAQQPQAEKPTALSAPALKPGWTVAPVAQEDGTKAVINRLLPADLNGDGVDELLVGRGDYCLCLDASGKQLWALQTGDRVNDMCVADVNGDGKPEVLIASDDEHLYITDAAGKVLANKHVEVPLRVGTSSVRDPRVANVAVADIDHDGKPDIIVGTRNGNIVRYDTDLNMVWRYDRIEHGTLTMKLVDLNKDGKLEIVAADRYGAVKVLDASGNPLPGSYSELGDVVFDLADLDGDGKYEIVNGSSTGALTCTRFSGGVLYRFDNFGYAVTAIHIADYDGDGKLETAIASQTGYVYLLNADGSVKAMRYLGGPVLSLAVLPEGKGARLVAGCRDGHIYVLDGELKPLAEAKGEGPVSWLAVSHGPNKQAEIVAASGGAVETFVPGP